METYLFSYGTLRIEKVQMQLFGRALTGVEDCLKGYKIELIEIKDALFLARGEHKNQQIVVPTKDNSNIMGTVFEISEDELLLSDKYEPDNYKRIKVVLDSGKEAWIYAAESN
jgi:gamma-glutamylcyclotransferase (GGCT)/AIG2-like uncharacterized protein YtfP